MAVLIELGRVDYLEALKIQREIHERRVADEIDDTLILLEHFPVITIGRGADKRNLLVSEDELARRGIKIYQVERGGDITYHGPGQLVGYPVFRLREGFVGVRRFVEKIEEVLIQALGEFGIEAGAKERMVGVWVGEKKIASIGIAVKNRVTMHGFALNVGSDLNGFQLINPCGLSSQEMTAMQLVLKDGGEVQMKEVRGAVRRGFEKVFGIVFNRISRAV